MNKLSFLGAFQISANSSGYEIYDTQDNMYDNSCGNVIYAQLKQVMLI